MSRLWDWHPLLVLAVIWLPVSIVVGLFMGAMIHTFDHWHPDSVAERNEYARIKRGMGR